MAPYMTPVSSSNLAAVGYDPMLFQLDVQFRNGRVYRYFNVPPATYSALMSSYSLGQFFDWFIKRAEYLYQRLV